MPKAATIRTRDEASAFTPDFVGDPSVAVFDQVAIDAIREMKSPEMPDAPEQIVKVYLEHAQDQLNTLADAKTAASVTRVFIDHCLALHLAGGLTAEAAAIAKLHTTELLCRVLGDCLQLHGGYGYREFPVARAWADARVGRRLLG